MIGLLLAGNIILKRMLIALGNVNNLAKKKGLINTLPEIPDLFYINPDTSVFT